MATNADERSPLFYARLAGAIYLIAMALGIFSQVVVLGRIVVPGDTAATAGNILASEGLFRLGIVLDVITFVGDALLAWAMYQLLRSVQESLALLGALLRVADAAILAVTTFGGIIVLQVLRPDYLRAFTSDQLHDLVRLFLSARGLGFYVGFVFLGLGSAAFAYLMFKSRYVPRILAGWGIFASLLLAAGSLAVMLSPWFADNLTMAFMVPMFFYEVPLGLWLLLKGVNTRA